MNARYLAWLGVVTAIVYSLIVASNVGLEFFGIHTLIYLGAFYWCVGLSWQPPWHFAAAVVLRCRRLDRRGALVLNCNRKTD